MTGIRAPCHSSGSDASFREAFEAAFRVAAVLADHAKRARSADSGINQ